MYTPIESNVYKGWFIIPSEPKYLASKEGKLRNVKTGYIINGTVATIGYRVMNVFNKETKKDEQRYLHRLICEAFYGPPKGNKNYVNHGDGDKLNNHYLNLEWVTAKRNSQHAVEVGLHDERIEMLVWDILENKTRIHPSIKDVKHSYTVLRKALGNIPVKLTKKNPLFKQRYYIRPTSIPEKLPELDDLRKEFIVVRSLTTGKEYFMSKQDSVFRSLNVKSSAVGMALQSKSRICNCFLVGNYNNKDGLTDEAIRYALKYRWKVGIDRREFVVVNKLDSGNQVCFTTGLEETMKYSGQDETGVFNLLFKAYLNTKQNEGVQILFKEEANIIQNPEAVVNKDLPRLIFPREVSTSTN